MNTTYRHQHQKPLESKLQTERIEMENIKKPAWSGIAEGEEARKTILNDDGWEVNEEKLLEIHRISTSTSNLYKVNEKNEKVTIRKFEKSTCMV